MRNVFEGCLTRIMSRLYSCMLVFEKGVPLVSKITRKRCGSMVSSQAYGFDCPGLTSSQTSAGQMSRCWNRILKLSHLHIGHFHHHPYYLEAHTSFTPSIGSHSAEARLWGMG